MRMKMEWMNWFRKSPWATPLAIAGPLGISIGFLGIQQLAGQDDSVAEPPSAGTPSVDFPPQDPYFADPNDLAPPDLPSPAREPDLAATTASPLLDTGTTTWAPAESNPPTSTSPRPAVNRRVEVLEGDDIHVGWAQAPSAPQPSMPVLGVPPGAVTPGFAANPNIQGNFQGFRQPNGFGPPNGFGQQNGLGPQNGFGQQNSFQMNFAFNVDPEDQELTRKSNDLANKLHDRSLDEDEIAKLKAELKELLNVQFELRQSKRQKDLEKLKKEVASLEKSIADRSKKKEEIVERRMAQLTGEPDELGWEPNNQTNYPGIPRYYMPNAALPSQPMVVQTFGSNGGAIHTTRPLSGSTIPNLQPPMNQPMPMPNSSTLPSTKLQPPTDNQDSAKRIEELEREIRRLKSSRKQVPTSTT